MNKPLAETAKGAAGPVTESAAPKKATPKKYLVRDAAIAPFGTIPRDVTCRLYEPGEVVVLDTKLAAHYQKLGRLDPYIEEDNAEEVTENVAGPGVQTEG